MAKPKNDYTYIIYPASGEASICSHFTAVFPNGFTPITHAGVDYYVLDNGTACDMGVDHAAMKAVCDAHTYPQELLDDLKEPVAEETAKADAHTAALAAAEAAYPGGSAPGHADNDNWRLTYDSEYSSSYDLAAAMAATPNPDPAAVNQAQAKAFVEANITGAPD